MEMYRKIVDGKIVYPPHFQDDEKAIIRELLQGDLTRRLGNMKGGVEGIKRHPYFKDVNVSERPVMMDGVLGRC